MEAVFDFHRNPHDFDEISVSFIIEQRGKPLINVYDRSANLSFGNANLDMTDLFLLHFGGGARGKLNCHASLQCSLYVSKNA